MTRLFVVAIAPLSLLGTLAVAQYPPGQHFSPNVHLISHVPLGAGGTVMDIEMEQELTRPFVYVSRSDYGKPALGKSIGFDVLEIKDPAKARVIRRWRIENQDLHQGLGGMAGKYFKLKGRYYYVQSFQFRGSGPDLDLGDIVFDVTSLPDTSGMRELGRIRPPNLPGGTHNLFAYKHSDGRTLLFITVEATPAHPYGAHVYDMEKFLAGAPDQGFVAGIPLPEPRGANRGYHDAYVAYDPLHHRDIFYGGGPETTPLGGNYVYDVTDLKNPKLLATIIAQSSMQSGGHTFVATPDGRYGMTIMTSLAHQPVRFWDLKPALDGTTPVIQQPIGEWTVAPTKSGHMIEIRWPYAFIADYEQGLRVLDIRNPTDPMQIGFYDTYNYRTPYGVGTEAAGAFGLDVRNADGLIVVPDLQSGFWAFRLDGFDGWNGHDWGMPNASSVQDWDNGPDGAPKSAKIS
jgi:hypothetical protein